MNRDEIIALLRARKSGELKDLTVQEWLLRYRATPGAPRESSAHAEGESPSSLSS